MISPEDLSLYKLTDSVDDAVDEIMHVLPRVSQHAVRAEPARVPAAAVAGRRIRCDAQR